MCCVSLSWCCGVVAVVDVPSHHVFSIEHRNVLRLAELVFVVLVVDAHHVFCSYCFELSHIALHRIKIETESHRNKIVDQIEPEPIGSSQRNGIQSTLLQRIKSEQRIVQQNRIESTPLYRIKLHSIKARKEG